jgi:hypothetical protein
MNNTYITIVTTVERTGAVLERVKLMLNASSVVLTFSGNFVVDTDIGDEDGAKVDD